MRRIRIFAVVLALGLVAAACGGTEDTTTTAAQETTTTAGAEETTTTADAEAGIESGVGVDPETMTIKLGALHDPTSAIFSPLVIDISDAMKTYFDSLNASGGIDGWMIDYIKDTEYDEDAYQEKYEELRDEVLALTVSTGGPTTVPMLESMAEDNMTFIPLSWYSGWAIPEFEGGLALEMNANYCIEAMNLLEFIRDSGGQTIALATHPSVYGFDAAAGVDLGAAFYGMDIVYDGRGAVIAGQDLTEVVTGIVESGADWVFVAIDPGSLAALLTQSDDAGYQGKWTGASPSYLHQSLADPELGPLLDEFYYQSAYSVPWGSDAPGQQAMAEAMRSVGPNRAPSDSFIVGWNHAITMHRVLADAIAAGHLTRKGVAEAVSALAGVDFMGTAPDQSYAGSPNEYVTRETAIFKPDLEMFTAAGGLDQTISQQDATTGSVLVQDFFVSDAADAFIFDRPCYGVPS